MRRVLSSLSDKSDSSHKQNINKSTNPRKKLNHSIETVPRQPRRVHIVNSPPVKKKITNWLRQEESSGHWVKQTDSCLPRPVLKKLDNNSQLSRARSPKFDSSIQHVLKATIRTPSRSPHLKTRVIKKVRSPTPATSKSPLKQMPSPTRNSKPKLRRPINRTKVFFDSATKNTLNQTCDLAQFHSDQNHSQAFSTLTQTLQHNLNQTQGKQMIVL